LPRLAALLQVFSSSVVFTIYVEGREFLLEIKSKPESQGLLMNAPGARLEQLNIVVE
jgi:hypothetical protein